MPRKVTRLIRAATEMKFAARTTAISLLRSPSLEAPVIQPLGQGLADGERSELGVLAFRVQQGLALLAEEHLLHLAEEDGVAAVRHLLHHAAVERHERVDQRGRSRGELGPVAVLEAALAALRAAERGRELPVLGAQHVDAEGAGFRHRAVRGGELVDAYEHRGRLGAGRAHRGRGHAVAVPGVSAGDDVDRAGERAHARLELPGVERLCFHANILNMETHSFLPQALVYLAAGVIAVPVFRRLGLGSVLGYLVAGVVIGPWGLALISDPQTVLQFSEFGVVLLLFLIGLELNAQRVWSLRRAIFGLGGVQVAATIAVVAAVAVALGQSLTVGVVAGMGIAMSSTAIGLATLGEKNLLQTPGGQASFAVLLFQDLAVIPLLLVLGALGGESDGFHFMDLAKGVGMIVLLIGAGRVLVRLVLLGTSALTEWAGLSMALGAFLAGVMLADSEYRHELELDIEPFKGLLLGLFFIAIGMSIDLGLFLRAPWLVLGIALGIV